MRRLLPVFALLLVTATAKSAGYPSISPAQYLMQLATYTCSSAGQYICNVDCDEVLLCVSNGEGGFEQIVLEQCADNYRCSAVDHTCVSGPTACGGGSSTGPITCHSRGLFPDPYNCSVYHICVAENTVSLPGVCDAGWAWNPASSDCSLSSTDTVCTDGPVDTCLTVGQTGTVAGNPSIYYICVNRNGTLIPDLHKCPHGQEYHPAEYACVNSSTSPTTVTSSPPTPSPTQPTPPPDPSGPIAGEPCPLPLQKVADPDDCTRYYECSPNYKWLHVACTIGFYYNPVHERCELGIC